MRANLNLRRLILLGTPLVLAILMIFHPWPYDDVEGELVPMANFWLALHTIQLVLFALIGVAVYLLTDDLSGKAVVVSRIAAVVFGVFYNAGDAIAGISTGILAQSAVGLPAREQAAVAGAVETLFHDPTKNLLFAVGIYAWILALVAAAIALYRAGAPRVPLVLLALPAYLLTFDHARPFGSLTFGSFFLIALWLELARQKRTFREDASFPGVASASEMGPR